MANRQPKDSPSKATAAQQNGADHDDEEVDSGMLNLKTAHVLINQLRKELADKNAELARSNLLRAQAESCLKSMDKKWKRVEDDANSLVRMYDIV